MNEDTFDPMNRRRFLERATAAGAILASGSLFSQAAQSRQPSRLAYDISRFTITDPKLIGYEEKRRYKAVAERARRICPGENGYFFVACQKGVLEFSESGSLSREFATPQPARCLAKHKNGRIFIGCREGIYVFSAAGDRTAFWPAPSSKSWITAIDTDDESVFAADSGARLVLRYDFSGKVMGRIGERNKDTNVPGLILPSPYLDVKIGSDGLLRVNNTGRHCVELYTKDGSLELSWGKTSAAIEGFCGCCNPVAIDLFPDGRYVTCEKGLPRVKVYSATGEFQKVVAGTESFPENSKHGAARDSDGTMGGVDAAALPNGQVLVLDLVTADVRLMQPVKA